MKSLIQFVTTAIIVVTASGVFSAPLLPEPFKLPTTPSPDGSTCANCSGQGKAIQPVLTKDGRATMDIPLAPAGALESSLLTITLGVDMAFYPSEKYQILLQNNPRGDKDYLVVVLNQQRVIFNAHVNELGNLTFYSANYPGYAIRREGELLVVTSMKSERQFLFSSPDAGYSWQLSAIRSTLFPALRIHCDYDKKGQLSAVVIPDNSKYEIIYRNGLAESVSTPSGERTTISWDGNSHIKAINRYLTPKHPYYPKEKSNIFAKAANPFLVANFNVTCDRMGRLLSLVNTNGEKFTSEYFSDGADKKKEIKKFERVTLVSTDGTVQYASNTWKTDGVKFVERGYIQQDEAGNTVYDATDSELMMRKASTLTNFEENRNGRIYRLKYDGATLAITAEIDPLGQITKFEYDSMGRRTATIYPDGSIVRSAYDQQDHLIARINELAQCTSYKYSTGGFLQEVDDKGIVTRYEYDKENRPVKTILPGGIEHRFAWDGLSRLVSHIKPDGVTVKYHYASSLPDIVSIETIPNDNKVFNFTVNYGHDQFGRLTEIAYPDKTAERFVYDCCNMVKSIDRAGAVTTFAYNQAHRKVLQISPNDEKTKYEYNYRGKPIKITYPNGLTEQYAYDQHGNKEAIKQTDGTIIKYTYDGLNRKCRETWPDNRYSTYAYDQRNRLLSVMGDKAKNLDYQYNLAGQLIATTDFGFPRTAPGRNEKWDYGQQGNLNMTVLLDGTSQVFFYRTGTNEVQGTLHNNIFTYKRFDKAGRVISISEIPWKRWQSASSELEKVELASSFLTNDFSYDGFGNLFEIHNADRRLVARNAFRPDGLLLSTISPTADDGARETNYSYMYGTDGLLLTSVYQKSIIGQSLAQVNYIAQEAIGLLASTVSAIPTTVARGRLVRQYATIGQRKLYEIDELGRRTNYTYNTKGQLITVNVNGQDENRFEYNDKALLVSTRDALGRVHESIYGKEGRIIGIKLPGDAETNFVFDSYGRMVARYGAGEYPLNYKYSSFGEPVAYTNGNGATTRFIFDQQGRLVQRILANGSTSSYAYNKSGQLMTKVEAERTTTYSYDDLNRLVRTMVADRKDVASIEMKYDKNGNLLEITDGKTTIKYAYDDFGRVTEENGSVGVVNYEYNAKGLLAVKICSFHASTLVPGKTLGGTPRQGTNGSGDKTDAFVTKYVYDEFDRLCRVMSPVGVFCYEYDINGKLSTLKMGNRFAVGYEYDNAGRLVGKTLNSKSICHYKYDSLDRLACTEISGVKSKYDYDLFNQPVSIETKYPGGQAINLKYVYDSAGNRLKNDDVVYTYNKLNQLVSSFPKDNPSDVTHYEYDAYGNMTRVKDSRYIYDLLNRLIAVEMPAISYKLQYDPLGQLIKVSTSAINTTPKTTCFLMSGMMEQAQVNDSNTLFHTIGLDNTRHLFSAKGKESILASGCANSYLTYAYDGFGNTIASMDNKNNTWQATINKPLRYFSDTCSTDCNLFSIGMGELKFSRNSHRFYDVTLDRFLSCNQFDAIQYRYPAGFAHSSIGMKSLATSAFFALKSWGVSPSQNASSSFNSGMYSLNQYALANEYSDGSTLSIESAGRTTTGNCITNCTQTRTTSLSATCGNGTKCPCPGSGSYGSIYCTFNCILDSEFVPSGPIEYSPGAGCCSGNGGVVSVQ